MDMVPDVGRVDISPSFSLVKGHLPICTWPPCCFSLLTMYNGEAVWTDLVSISVVALMDGGDGALRYSLSLSQKVLPAFEFVDYPTLLKCVILVLECNGGGVFAFEINLYFLVLACPFKSVFIVVSSTVVSLIVRWNVLGTLLTVGVVFVFKLVVIC